MEKHSAYVALMPGWACGCRRRLLVPTRTPSTACGEPTRGEVQPVLRPRRDRRGPGLPALHEALRRWAAGAGTSSVKDREARTRPMTSRRDAECASAQSRGRGLRGLCACLDHRARDDVDEVPARPADARTGMPWRTTSSMPRRGRRRSRSRRRSTSSGGSSTPARCSSRTGSSIDRLRQRLPGCGSDPLHYYFRG